MKIPKNTVCLMFNKEAEQAARFYAEILPNSSVGSVHRAPNDYPSGKAGAVGAKTNGVFLGKLHLAHSPKLCRKVGMKPNAHSPL